MLGFVEVMLRVPPLFLIDEILKVGLGLSEFAEDLADFDNFEVTSSYFSNYSTAYIAADPLFYRYLLISFTRLIFGTLGEYLRNNIYNTVYSDFVWLDTL